jgi:hypothetical protein
MTDSLQSKILVAVGLIIVCLAGAYFFTLPNWNNYSVTKSVIAQKQMDQAELKASFDLADNFVKEYNSKLTDAQLANLALPAKDSDLSNLVFVLGDLARSSGLALSNFSMADLTPIAGTVPENGIQAQTITLDASGTYESFKDFILRLQNNIRIMDVDQISAKVEDSGQVKYQMVLRVYYQK